VRCGFERDGLANGFRHKDLLDDRLLF